MQEPPDDFMRLTEMNCRHDYRQGVQDGFHWLQSRQIEFLDFFKWMPPPSEGFRLLLTAWDGRGGAYPYGLEDGLTSSSSSKLSLPLREWPTLLTTGNGEAAYVLAVTAVDLSFEQGLSAFEEIDGFEQLDDFSLPKIQRFWNIVHQLDPIFYICDWRFFTMVARSEACFNEFTESESFRNLESKLKADANAQRSNLWNYYCETLGPECGPEQCVETECDRLRIQLAIRCLRHQLEKNNPGWFGSDRFFNLSAKRLELLPDKLKKFSSLTLVDKNACLLALALSDKVQCWSEPFGLQSVPQKVYSAIRILVDEVNSGGFSQYFVNGSSETAPFVITALETIGARRVADICRRAIQAAFPDGLPESQQAIVDFATARYGATSEELEPLDREFFACSGDLTEPLFAFVLKYPDEFGDVSNFAET